MKPKAASCRLNCQQYYNTRHLAASLFLYDFFKRGMGKIFINPPSIYSNCTAGRL
ncbi:phycobilisome linker polypeptide [Neisseria gonorrhoeae]|uniref:Phycobilisome linker polypeptide n=1 Tax=Neisseria gonorrhoeae TaxID=485 RepID=A0AAX2TS86_NEIGO|nr:phycobilisome linker polypeptide [Neisseria gonorrhoeae]ARC01721.1 phycobilisome linker polypeptide [Neisseria gonorrhoeae]ARC03550.1 phycobilisome linker polypeptide [Neisseria gonorrhoeae]ASQ71339.1 phycobilisome linker polypeptide [Neisseria gonorrhoeae]ASQ73347.1 phycobilisome linker polypeptide [Neisseria gonorrhoeae]